MRISQVKCVWVCAYSDSFSNSLCRYRSDNENTDEEDTDEEDVEEDHDKDLGVRRE